MTFTHFHLFCGIGGGAMGYNRGSARVGNLQARFECIGGIDVDPASIADFNRNTKAQGTVMDLFDLEQYVAFHGKMPPAGWRAMEAEDIRRAAGGRYPNIIFLSAPCKGFSGLLPEASSKSAKYQALNRLTLRGVWLAMEAFKDDPPDLVIFENVPRIMTRGRPLLDQIHAIFRHYGYAVAESTHDCGELGNLGQSRKRFLLVARHQKKVPPFLWQPEKRALRGVGEILSKLPLPGDPAAGPMHRMPALQWKTWVRLAFVEAGKDWRSLNRLAVEDGMLRDFGIMPTTSWRDDVMGVLPWENAVGVITGKSGPTNGRFAVADPREFEPPHNGALGVNGWDDNSGTVTSNGRPMSGNFSVADPRPPEETDRANYGVAGWGESTGAITSQRSPGQGTFSVADPRVDGHAKSVQLGVKGWEDTAGVVKGDMSVGGGPYAIADVRVGGESARFSNIFRVVDFAKESPAVTAGGGPTAGGLAVADPRSGGAYEGSGKYQVTAFDEESGTVIAASTTGHGAFGVADPRPPKGADDSHGKFHMTPFDGPSRAVIGGRDNGAAAVADPRTNWPEETHSNKLAVDAWDETGKTVSGARFGSGAGAVADPRPGLSDNAHQNILHVSDWDQKSKTVTGATHVAGGALSVADPRPVSGLQNGAHGVRDWEQNAGTVAGESLPSNGAFSVADPRPVGLNENRKDYITGGHYGVVGWDENSGAVPASANTDNGRWSVADPRDVGAEPLIQLPKPDDRLVAVIRALDNTWHRPFTTLELAALQSLVDPDEMFSMDGKSDSAWRERIGNAVPPDAAQAIASVMGTTLLLAATGETFVMSSQPIWVQPMMVGLSVDQEGNIPHEHV